MPYHQPLKFPRIYSLLYSTPINYPMQFHHFHQQVIIEKRDRMSRNNVLHLWPFVIQDLRALGAKKFFGKFCAGSIDHISIRQLQCILMKVRFWSLSLGKSFHSNTQFARSGPIAVTDNCTKFDHPEMDYGHGRKRFCLEPSRITTSCK